jgi:hypothetical protein
MLTQEKIKTDKSLDELLKENQDLMNQDEIKEEFKDIYLDNNKTGYKISNLGYVLNSKGDALQIIYLNDYAYVVLYNSESKKHERFRLNILVATFFCPYRADDLCEEVHHITKNRRDNRYCNLIFVSRKEHKTIHSNMGDYLGENNNTSKYSNKQIRELCRLLELDIYTPTELSERTGVSKDMISLIRGRKAWTHISCDYDISPLFTHPDKETVIKVCEMLEQGATTSKISKDTNVAPRTISDIRCGRRHADISKDFNIKRLRNFHDLDKIHKVCKLMENPELSNKKNS